MKTRIVRVEVEAEGLVVEVDVAAKLGTFETQPVHSPRAGWAEAFQRMSENCDDEPLELLAVLDDTEWEW